MVVKKPRGVTSNASWRQSAGRVRGASPRRQAGLGEVVMVSTMMGSAPASARRHLAHSDLGGSVSP
jgi:hypothetical protein